MLETAVDYATKVFDVVIVAAAGNEGRPLEQGVFPANFPAVIAVGATTHDDQVPAFSNYGGPLDLVAPGGGDAEPASAVDPGRSIVSLLAIGADFGKVCDEVYKCNDLSNDECLERLEICWTAPWVVFDQYVRTGGTSMAAAHVSGAAALVRSRHREFSARQVRQVLLQSADDLGAPGWDMTSGYGRVNARRALETESIPVAQLLTPGNRGKVWSRNLPFVVRGTALSPNAPLHEWRLTMGQEGGNHLCEIAHGNKPVEDNVLDQLTAGEECELVPGKQYVLDLAVEDASGDIARDRSTFLVPNQHYAVVPIPDPFDEGSGAFSLSADGTRLALGRGDRGGGNSVVWLYDASTRGLQRVDEGTNGSLSASGQLLIYYSSARSYPNYAVLYDVDTRSKRDLPAVQLFGSASFRLTPDGMTLAFLSDADLDPAFGNADRSWEAFLYNLPDGPLQQVTRGPHGGGFGREVDDLAWTLNGRRLSFTSFNPLDPTASANGRRQAFVYNIDDDSLRQITGRDGRDEYCEGPTLDADGNKLACRADGLIIVDVASGKTDRVLDRVMFPGPLLSADGRLVVFTSSRDLDPAVGNEDLNPEVFVLDLTKYRHSESDD